MQTATYAYSKTLNGVDFDEVLQRVSAALKSQGFGVLTEIDVQATLKQKLDVDFRRYRILGACNPSLAHQALSQELTIGLLLPCNVVVYEGDSGDTVVSFTNPKQLFKVVDSPAVSGLADEVDQLMRNALEAV